MTTTTTELKVINEEDKPVAADTVVVVVEDITTPKTVEVDTSDIGDLTKFKPLVTDTLPTRNRTARPSLKKTICGSTISLVILGIISIIPLLQLVVGWRYANECPVSWRIPHYLVVAGTLGLVVVILTIVQGLLALYLKNKALDPDLPVGGLAAACGVCGISILLAFLFIFLIGWFIAGCIWVSRPWSKVQYRNTDQPDYCHPILYRFAYWLLFISILYIIFSCGRAFTQSFKQLKNRRKSSAIPVPTTEQ